jgi:hypothetical protein
MLPPLCSALALRVGAQRAQQRVALLAGPVASTAMTTNIAVIAPSSAQPWRASPPAEDEAQRRRDQDAEHLQKLDSGVGFS